MAFDAFDQTVFFGTYAIYYRFITVIQYKVKMFFSHDFYGFYANSFLAIFLFWWRNISGTISRARGMSTIS